MPHDTPITHQRAPSPDIFSGFVPPILTKGAKRGARPGNGVLKKLAPTKTAKADATPKTDAPAKIRPNKDPLHGYAVQDRLTYVGTQVCPTCERTTNYIAGDLIRYAHVETSGQKTVRTRAYSAVDSRFGDLKRTIEYLEAETCACPECLRLDILAESALASRGQLPLELDTEQPSIKPHNVLKPGTVEKHKIRKIFSTED